MLTHSQVHTITISAVGLAHIPVDPNCLIGEFLYPIPFYLEHKVLRLPVSIPHCLTVLRTRVQMWLHNDTGCNAAPKHRRRCNSFKKYLLLDIRSLRLVRLTPVRMVYSFLTRDHVFRLLSPLLTRRT